MHSRRAAALVTVCGRPARQGDMNIMSGRLAAKVAVVTGAGSRGEGIGNGRAAAILFAREGAAVVCADLVVARADETVAAIVAEGGTASSFACDVSHREGCQQLAAVAVESYGRLDILQKQRRHYIRPDPGADHRRSVGSCDGCQRA